MSALLACASGGVSGKSWSTSRFYLVFRGPTPSTLLVSPSSTKTSGSLLPMESDSMPSSSSSYLTTKRTDIDTSQIVVFGRSLGGAVGSVPAKNNPDKVSALILENTFTFILDMAGVLLPFCKGFIGGSDSKSLKVLNHVVRSPWITIDIIGQVRQPILFLSGLQDEMVPPIHMKLLYAKALHEVSIVSLWSSPLGCMWTHGWLVWTNIGQRLNCLLRTWLLRRNTRTLLA